VKRPGSHWFLPDSYDVLALLGEQVDVTVEGMDAFARWGAGEQGAAEEVRDSEHKADDRRRALVKAIRESFTTPLEPEDLFELSTGLDEVINGAKNTVRESEALQMAPDRPMADMTQEIASGVRHLQESLAAVGHDPVTASEAAARATKVQRGLERTYRLAMAALVEGGDLRQAVGRQELYRRLDRISDAIVVVAERVVYATVKEG